MHGPITLAPLSLAILDPRSSILDLAGVLLFLGACLGHAVLMICALNCLYGTALPHKLLSVTRKLDGLVVLAGPVVFWFAFGLHLIEFGAHFQRLEPGYPRPERGSR